MNKKVRRICLFAGPGVGKTVAASALFARLRIEGHKIEYVDEEVKRWAYQGRIPSKYDQLYLFGKQMQAETTYLDNGVDLIITDSPVMLSIPYGIKYGIDFHEEMTAIYKRYDADYPSINLFLERRNGYETQGRFETESQALEMDAKILNYIKMHVNEWKIVNAHDHEHMLEYIQQRLEEK